MYVGRHQLSWYIFGILCKQVLDHQESHRAVDEVARRIDINSYRFHVTLDILVAQTYFVRTSTIYQQVTGYYHIAARK
jgi:hypothetical protein